MTIAVPILPNHQADAWKGVIRYTPGIDVAVSEDVDQVLTRVDDRLGSLVPANIIEWVQDLREERYIEAGRLLVDEESLAGRFRSGIPPVYGIETIDEVVR